MIASEHHIIRHIHGAHKAHADTVLRHKRKAYAQFLDRNGIHLRQILPAAVVVIEKDLSALGNLQTGDSLQKLFLAASGNTGDSQDLSAVHRNVHIIQSLHAFLVFAGKAFDLQAFLHIVRFRTVDIQIHLGAYHHLGETLYIRLRSLHRIDIPAFPEDRHPVRKRQNLLKLMGNDDNGASILTHIAENVKKPVRLLRRQHRRRLVQDQDLRSPVKHLDDLHRLFLRNRHLINLLRKIQIETISVQKSLDLLGYLLHIQHLLTRKAENDILRRGQHIHQLEMLVHHTDSQFKRISGRTDRHFFAVHKNMAGIRIIDSVDHIHQRSLAAAVLPQDRKDL